MNPGGWEIKAEKEGYDASVVSIDLVAGETRDMTFQLGVPGDGFIRIVASPYADFYLNGQKVLTEKRQATLQVGSTERHTVELRHPPSFGRIALDNIRVSPGDTLDLGRKVFTYGSLTISSNMAVHVVVDGENLEGQTPTRIERIAVGEHLISVHREGLFIREAQLVGAGGGGGQTLSPVNPGSRLPQYRVQIAENQQVAVRFEMNRSE
jgi:hypothetical protein